MGRKKLKDKLEMVQGAVSPQVAALLRKMAIGEGRSLSAIVRRVLEQSPSVRAEIRGKGK